MTLQEKLNRIRQETPQEAKLMIDHSFAIVDRIDEIMTKNKISQRELAKLLGKKESEVSKWMRGTHNFTIKTIAKLEAILGEPILQLQVRKPAILVFQVQNGTAQQLMAVRGALPVNSDKTKKLYTTVSDTQWIVNELTEQYN